MASFSVHRIHSRILIATHHLKPSNNPTHSTKPLPGFNLNTLQSTVGVEYVTPLAIYPYKASENAVYDWFPLV